MQEHSRQAEEAEIYNIQVLTTLHIEIWNHWFVLHEHTQF
jgi:hypothetical protein